MIGACFDCAEACSSLLYVLHAPGRGGAITVAQGLVRREVRIAMALTTQDLRRLEALLGRLETALQTIEAPLRTQVKQQRRDHLALVKPGNEDTSGSEHG